MAFIKSLFFAFSVLYLIAPLWPDPIQEKESALITHLVKEANQPGAHSEGDIYLLVKIGKTEYVAELQSVKVVGQTNAETPSGGFCKDYAEVSVNLLNQNRQETSQGASQILRWQKGKWKMVALSEGDYMCEKLKTIPTDIRKCLNIECN